jgi:RimJ/RimL family protein N-acetyltransferase
VIAETERLVLRRPRVDDVPRLSFLRDPEVMRFIGGVEAVPVEELVRRWLDRWEANGFGYVLLERREDGAVVGRSGLVLWDTRGAWRPSTLAEADGRGQAELGWALAREHWGNGYATEAAAAARRWAFEELGIERLVSLTDPRNVRSIGVVDRLGGEPEQLVPTVHGPAIVWVHPR